jgi:NADP-dependent aldehyde dehydrogenase
MSEGGLQPVLVAGQWRAARHAVGAFQPLNPATGEPLPERYPTSGREDMLAALEAGHGAAAALAQTPPEPMAAFLERFADLIEARRDELVQRAHLETGLPAEPRLGTTELPRTTNQLRQAAAAVRDRAWRAPVIDTRANIRAMHAPLGGPVVVMGPNNFPFAFNSVAGGDFAAAIAAHNPVIAKANPGHAGTTRLLAELAFQAVREAGLPEGTVQLLYQLPPALGLELVAHPLVGATAFTGSKAAGLQLKAAADAAGKPIYLEMSSVNPVFILPGALDERLDAIAGEFYTSCTMGAGQFCTNPGLVILPGGELGERFVQAAAERFAAGAPGVLLGAKGLAGLNAAVQALVAHGAQVVTGGQPLPGPGFRYANTILRATGAQFLADPAALQMEAYGPVSLLVLAESGDAMRAIAEQVEGSLTGTIYSHTGGQDDVAYDRLAPILRPRVGRLLNDKMPTGVAVSAAMNHGGPYPATGHPGFTGVGIPAAIRRFTALYSYDNVRPHRLPVELQDRNPTGHLWRLVDGAWTQGDVPAG